MYAIIETGGKQYKVQEGDVVLVEKLGLAAGETVNFDNVLVVANDNDLSVGTPFLENASVSASVLDESKGKKLVIYKYKAKKTYHKKRGHRQYYTKVKIEKINA